MPRGALGSRERYLLPPDRLTYFLGLPLLTGLRADSLDIRASVLSPDLTSDNVRAIDLTRSDVDLRGLARLLRAYPKLEHLGIQCDTVAALAPETEA